MDHDKCDECGFDGARYDDAALLESIRALGPQWRSLLASAGTLLGRRPAPDVWSALEYAAHSRDVTAMHVVGVEAALPGDEPVVPALPDDIADQIADGYAAEDPDAVLTALSEQATRLADIAAAEPAAWRHGLTVGTDRREVRFFLEHALHDSTHHLRDVERGLAQLRTDQS